MRQILALQKKEKQTENIITSVKAGAFVAAGAAGVYVAYLGVLAYSAAKDGIEDALGTIKETAHSVPISFFNWISGSKSYVDPETGIEYIVPKTVTDANGTVIENNIRIPILGGVNYLIMKFGNLINPIPFFYDPNQDEDEIPEGGWYGPHVPGHPDHDAWLAGEYQMTELEYYKYQVAENARIKEEEKAAREAERKRLLEEQGYDEDFEGPVIDMEKEEKAREEKAARDAAAAAAKAAEEAEQQRYYEEQRAAHAAALAEQAAEEAAKAAAEKAAREEREAEEKRKREEAGYNGDFIGPVPPPK